MAKNFKVYGDYGYESEQLLEEFDTLSEAIRWATGYTKDGDLGGYNQIEIASFASDGEYMTHWKVWIEKQDDDTLDDFNYVGSRHHN